MAGLNQWVLLHNVRCFVKINVPFHSTATVEVHDRSSLVTQAAPSVPQALLQPTTTLHMFIESTDQSSHFPKITYHSPKP